MEELQEQQHRRPSPPLLASDDSDSSAKDTSETLTFSSSSIRNIDWNNQNGIDGPTNTNTNTNTNIDADTNTNNESQDNNENSNSTNIRKGTLSSACFNILSTMVGGGSLSLPLAFHQAGNGFFAPLLLLTIAYLVQSSIRYLVEASQLSTKLQSSKDKDKNSNQKGTVSYESMSCVAFGPYAKYFTMGLISTICFFTIVGYGVLLRDMLLPLSDTIFPVKNDNDNDNDKNDGPTLAHNATLLFVILLVTPLCTLRNLTALEPVGAASMASLLILACCISYRSIQCNFSPAYDDVRLMPWYQYINYTPVSESDVSQWDNVLNALPILISVFMCHFNVLPVHNELVNPSKDRVNQLFTITIWGACGFYMAVGFIGSMYGNCTKKGAVEGNVLLSFDESDGLLMLGRACLSLTITFAFPILVVPARDIFLRGADEFWGWYEESKKETGEDEGKTGSEYRLRDVDDNDYNGGDGDLFSNNLEEPLLFDDYVVGNRVEDTSNEYFEDDPMSGPTTLEQDLQAKANAEKEKKDNIWRIVSSIVIFWSGAAVACCVKDIDVVWDFLGGSLSLIMGFLIPSGAFLVLYTMLSKKLKYDVDDDIEMDEIRQQGAEAEMEPMSKFDKIMAWALIIIFVPMMFTLTGNAVYNLGTDT